MQLDMPTISSVSIWVTAVLGLVLVFTWWRERTSALTGWWGVAMLIMSAGIIFAVIAAYDGSPNLHAFGQAWIILASALMWMAVRQFEGRRVSPFWIVVWPLGFLVAYYSGLLNSFDTRLIVATTLMAGFSFAAAFEFSRDTSEGLISRWPTVLLLFLLGAGYVTWMPLTLSMPTRDAYEAFSSTWLPVVILIATLERIALAFLILSIVKERQELKQRIDALTDPLTGLPNRRALFEAAAQLAEHGKYLRGDPVSVLVFDLDHFKDINDRFGHRLGDRVLRVFANTLADNLETGSIAGRLGGEEFAAILPGADLTTAAATAEAVRSAFATSAAFIDGTKVAGTVSVGVATHDDIDCDFDTLFHIADGALYAAKSAGRNRVELVAPCNCDELGMAASQGATPKRIDTPLESLPERLANTRRYRRSRLQTPLLRPRRGVTPLS